MQSPRLFLTMQTSLLGQSLSSLHPSSFTGSGTKKSNIANQNMHTVIAVMLTNFGNSFKLTWCACNAIGISFISRKACAHSSVVPNSTVSKSGTLTRIHTFFISAGKCWYAIGISETLILLATNVWIRIWFEVWEAGADSSVVLSRALGINATLFKKAWINALPVQTGLCQWTL